MTGAGRAAGPVDAVLAGGRSTSSARDRRGLALLSARRPAAPRRCRGAPSSTTGSGGSSQRHSGGAPSLVRPLAPGRRRAHPDPDHRRDRGGVEPGSDEAAATGGAGGGAEMAGRPAGADGHSGGGSLSRAGHGGPPQAGAGRPGARTTAPGAGRALGLARPASRPPAARSTRSPTASGASRPRAALRRLRRRLPRQRRRSSTSRAFGPPGRRDRGETVSRLGDVRAAPARRTRRHRLGRCGGAHARATHTARTASAPARAPITVNETGAGAGRPLRIVSRAIADAPRACAAAAEPGAARDVGVEVVASARATDDEGGAWTPGDAFDDAVHVLEVIGRVLVIVATILRRSCCSGFFAPGAGTGCSPAGGTSTLSTSPDLCDPAGGIARER